MPDAASDLVARAAARYLPAGRSRGLAWGFARGKLQGDPVYLGILRHGLLGDRRRLLDLGCGKGYFESLLVAALDAPELLPAGFPPLPPTLELTGIELHAGDVALAQRALADRADIRRADLVQAPFPAADLVLILDVLHYLPEDAQSDILRRARAALAPGGRLLLRVGDARGGWRYRWSQFVDRVVAFRRTGRWLRLWGRAAGDWRAELERLGFRVQDLPMSAGTAFANLLLVADVP
jgi:SAM-dependent methyltransferase